MAGFEIKREIAQELAETSAEMGATWHIPERDKPARVGVLDFLL